MWTRPYKSIMCLRCLHLYSSERVTVQLSRCTAAKRHMEELSARKKSPTKVSQQHQNLAHKDSKPCTETLFSFTDAQDRVGSHPDELCKWSTTQRETAPSPYGSMRFCSPKDEFVCARGRAFACVSACVCLCVCACV